MSNVNDETENRKPDYPEYYPDPDKCPPLVRHSLDRYVTDGVPLGGFLEAVVSNNLMEAMGRADSQNAQALPHIVAYIYNCVPHNSHGSREKYVAWVNAHMAQRVSSQEKDEQ